MRLPSPAVQVLFLVALSLFHSRAEAQALLPEGPEPVPAFGKGLVSTSDTTALVVNPANLGWLSSWELRYDAVLLQNEQLPTPDGFSVPWQGHAFSLGLPLFGGLATGLRVDAMDPPVGSLLARNYRYFTWGLGWGPTQSSGLGISVQKSFSKEPLVDDLVSVTIGATARPWKRLGYTVVFRNFNEPTHRGPDPNDPATDIFRTVRRSYDFGVAIRPTGTRAVEIGLETRLIPGPSPSEVVPRATVGVDIPPIGRLSGEVSFYDLDRDPVYVASGGLSVYFNGVGGSTELYGGVVTGTGIQPDDSYNPYFGASIRGWREPAGLKGMRYAVKIRMENSPGARGHVALLRQLWSLAEEPRVDAVVFELRTSPGRMARVQELRDAIFLLRQKGKRVLCHLEDAPGSALYLCAAANRVLINPGGGVRFAGLSSRHFYFAGLLNKLGVRADFVRIGDHKSAPEQFTRERATDTARADKTDLLQQYERYFTGAVAAGRNLTVERTREVIGRGPFIAEEARKGGLVDGYAYDDELEQATAELVGRHTPLREDKRAVEAPKRFDEPKKVAIVYVEGDMVDGRSRTVPFLGTKILGSYTIADTLKQLRENPGIGAIVLRIETGGGSAMAAEVIWRQVKLTAARKPIVVSMGGAAASGGYYIAAPATRIFANPLTITGSIGIFYGKADVAQLLRKIGVNVEVYKTAPRADAESLFRPFTPEERKELQRKVAQFYDTFISRVAEGRKMSKTDVDKVGQGRVWTGEQASTRGLVDEVGGLRQALDFARKTAGLPDDAPIVELPPPDGSLLGRLLGIEGLRARQTDAVVPPQLKEMVQALAPFAIYRGDQPLARMELEWVEP